MLSMKHAASRPRPPLPSAASGSITRRRSRSTPSSPSAARTGFRQTQIVQRVQQQAAEQELQREIVHALAVLGVIDPRGRQPAIHHPVTHRQGGGDEPVPVGGDQRVAADRVGHLGHDQAAERGGILILRRQRNAGHHALPRRRNGGRRHIHGDYLAPWDDGQPRSDRRRLEAIRLTSASGLANGPARRTRFVDAV